MPNYPKSFKKNNYENTKIWLHQLASKGMSSQGSIFQIEQIQPKWLSEKEEIVYRIATGLIVSSILGLIAGFYFIYYCELMRQDKSIPIAITNTLKFSLMFGAFGILYMLARRFIIMPEFYKHKPFYVIYDVIAIMIVGAVYGGFRIKNPGGPLKQGEPNQGIIRSATYTVISFTICTMIAILCAYIFDPVKNLVLIFIGLSVGLLGGLGANQGSGIVCIQHFILRVVLCKKGYIPWNYARFLNYANERVLLRKSGGAYLFFHPEIMDYFAKMDLNSGTASRR